VVAQAASSGQVRPDGLGFGMWVAALMLAGLILYPLTLAWHQAPDLGHGWAAPLLILWLWWERREARPPFSGHRTPGLVAGVLLGLGLVLLLLLRLLLAINPVWPVALALHTLLGLVLVLGLTYYWAGRPGLRWVAPPLIVLAGALPWPTWVDYTIIMPLRETLTLIVAEICSATGRPAVALGTTLRLAGGTVGIDEACGGIRSLQAAVMVALFAGEWLRLGWCRRGLILLGGIVAALAGNLGRVFFLSWCAAQDQALLDRWHDTAGWVALGLTLGLTGVLAWLLRRPVTAMTPAPAAPRIAAESRRAIRTWGAVGLAGWVLIDLGTRLWFALPPPAPPALTGEQWTVRFPVEAPAYRREPLAERAREYLRPDLYLAATWQSRSREQRAAYYIEWHGGEMARHAPFEHNPAICLPYSGYTYLGRGEDVVVSWDGGELVFLNARFELGGTHTTVAYLLWDPSRNAPLERPVLRAGMTGFWTQYGQRVIARQRHQPGQVLAVAVAGEPDPALLAQLIAELIVPVAD
jgi:exosortase